MPNNPQNTLSTMALKSYNHFISLQLESLDWIKFTNKDGNSIRFNTNKYKNNTDKLDFINVNVNVLFPPSELNLQAIIPNVDPPIHMPIVTSTHSRKATDWKLIHRCLSHISDDKLSTMCSKQIMRDLPKTFPVNQQTNTCQCNIFWKGKAKHSPHGETSDTTHLNLGPLLHMDFMFMNKPSICGFASILLFVYSNSRKLWIFCTQTKSPPVSTVRFFLHQLRKQQISPLTLHTDEGGDISRSTEICKIIHDEFQISLETTGAYASWLNGKEEHHIRTIANMI